MTEAASRKAFPLRLDVGAAEALARLASAEFRSTNAQIEVMLRSRLTRKEAPTEVMSPGRGAERKAIALRLSDSVYAQVASHAERGARSVNAQIEMWLMEEIAARGGARAGSRP